MQGDTWASAMASAQVDSFGKEMIEEQQSYMYKYMGEVPIPILGMVDDLIGIAEAGYKTHLLNVFINVKTADKDLQFGAEKCKTMTVSKKKPFSFQTPAFSVDTWEIKYSEHTLPFFKVPFLAIRYRTSNIPVVFTYIHGLIRGLLPGKISQNYCLYCF